MSYSMWFECPCCERTLEECNITYNHSATFKELFGTLGIRILYNKTASDVHEIAKSAARELMSIKGAEEYEESWEPTKRNAMLALLRLANTAAKAHPNSILRGD